MKGSRIASSELHISMRREYTEPTGLPGTGGGGGVALIEGASYAGDAPRGTDTGASYIGDGALAGAIPMADFERGPELTTEGALRSEPLTDGARGGLLVLS